MIKSVALTNFRKHENLSVNFGSGLNVIKAPNEGGKSTALEGIAYALFGSKALRTNFADTVTHGKPESSLKVEVVLEIEGRVLNVKRSKGGAEVVEGGKVIVVGQTEVTSYLSGLIGADANAAGKLMVASQGNLRGALESGPKAMSETIESLAGFGTFETLIESAQEKLMLGNTDVIASQVDAAEATLEAMTEPVAPDLTALDAQVAAIQSQIAGFSAESDRLFALAEAAEKALQMVEGRRSNWLNVQQQVVDVTASLGNLSAQHSALLADAVCIVTPEAVQAKRDEIVAARDWAAVAKAFTEFSALTYPKAFWEGTREEFEAAWARTVDEVTSTDRAAQKILSDLALLKKSKVTSSLCGFCGKDFSSFPEIAVKNAEIDNDIAVKLALLKKTEEQNAEAKIDVEAYSAISRSAKPFTDIALRLEKWVAVDESFYPPRLAWAGSSVSRGVDLAVLQAELASLESTVRLAGQASAKASVVAASINAANESLEVLRLRLATEACPDTEVEAAAAAKIAAHKSWQDAYQAFSAASVDLSVLQRQRDDAARDYAEAKRVWDGAVAVLAEKKSMLEEMRFNNGLLKKIRASRPIIADKLWSMVLSSVSSMFSRMRGEVSVVAKAKDGFTVNGSAVESLSGSTLDLLGLALRVALTRTFIPHSPFLVLDEPFSAADVDRTASMLAFIQTSGFSQVILVTHEDLSSAIADNLVEL